MAGPDDARAWADRLLGGDVLATAIQQELDRVVARRPVAERHAQLVAIESRRRADRRRRGA